MVTAVLLLACANLAHLLLARASARAHEFRVRLAIGASRVRIVRQLLTESLLLGVFGGVAGVLVAYGLGRILLGLVITDPDHSTLAPAPDASLLAFNFAIALAASIGFGLAPALKSSRSNLASGLKGAHSGHSRQFTGRKIMMAVQVALSLVLLTGAGLFIRSLINLRGIDVGFRTDRLLQITLNPSAYPAQSLAGFYADVVEQVKSIPGVQAAAFGRQRLISGDAWNSGIVVAGYNPSENERGPNRDAIGPAYFSALGIPLIAGREFIPSDTAAAPKVAIVNEAFAKLYFGDQNPLGKCIGPGGGKPDYTIVGVTRNARYREMREAAMPFWYVPFDQLTEKSTFRALTLFVRTSSDPDRMANSIRAAVERVDRNIALFNIKSVETQIGDNVRLERLLATLSIFFGVVAAVLAGAGLFGVLSYSVAQRKRELGIRIAVGARPSLAVWTIVRGVALSVFIGAVGGLAAALGLSSLVGRLLFGIQPNDPVTLAVAALAVSAIALLAASLPLSRAAKVDPAAVLRCD
jgi:predicted permease